MTKQEQKIAIAEACGFKREERGYGSFTRIEDGEEITYYPHDLPDYLNDLNEMHDAEKVLSPANWSKYLSWLGYCGENNTGEVYGCVTATAAQRAEAFLRTIGKWEDGK